MRINRDSEVQVGTSNPPNKSKPREQQIRK